jgi:photosystem II stability/assembly factor-like uncharacterized protein
MVESIHLRLTKDSPNFCSCRKAMYSAKRRFRLFRHPAWSGGGEVDDTVVYTYSWAEQVDSPIQRYATFDLDNTGDTAVSTRWTATDGAEGPYISTDKGATWTRKVTGMTFGTGFTNSPCLARSTPSIMYAPVSSNGYLYKTTNGGDSWTELTSAGARNWASMSCDSTGSNVVASAGSTALYKSTDGGSNWTVLSNSGAPSGWDQTFISDDGNVIAGVVFGGLVIVSTDGGSTFTSNTSFGTKAWRGLSGSSDGSLLFASYVGTTGGVALSTDSGATWTDITESVGGLGTYWNTAASVNGNKLVTARDSDYVYISQDRGITWSRETSAGVRSWEGVGVSADGTTVMAGATGGAKVWVATGT